MVRITQFLGVNANSRGMEHVYIECVCWSTVQTATDWHGERTFILVGSHRNHQLPCFKRYSFSIIFNAMALYVSLSFVPMSMLSHHSFLHFLRHHHHYHQQSGNAIEFPEQARTFHKSDAASPIGGFTRWLENHMWNNWLPLPRNCVVHCFLCFPIVLARSFALSALGLQFSI